VRDIGISYVIDLAGEEEEVISFRSRMKGRGEERRGRGGDER